MKTQDFHGILECHLCRYQEHQALVIILLCNIVDINIYLVIKKSYFSNNSVMIS